MTRLHDIFAGCLRITIVVLVCSASVQAQVPCRYTVEYLPNPSPCAFWDRYIAPTGISPNGRYVCGGTDDCGTGAFAVVVDTQTMAMTIIPRPQGVISMRAYGVNNNMEVCGAMTYFLGTGGDRAYLWRNGVVNDLGVPLNATDSYANAINNKGEITGYSYIAGGSRAYLWRNGTFTLLNLPMGPNSVGHAIDEESRIVGYMGGNPVMQSVPFLWFESQATALTLPAGAHAGGADAIALNGQIAGTANVGDPNSKPLDVRRRAFIIRNGIVIDLGLLPGAIESSAAGTNGSVTVGTCSLLNDSSAFIFANGQIRRLEQMQPNPNLHIYGASAISTDGSITAPGAIISTIPFTHYGLVLRPVSAPVGDITHDCRVGVPDLLAVINSWGPCSSNPFCPADLNQDATVIPMDILVLIQHWGEQS